MKRLVKACIILLLIFTMISDAAAKGGGFTHPEIGELIELGYNNDMPFFGIYGFTQYIIMDPGTKYRGMRANNVDLIHKKMLGLDESLNLFFDSIEGKSDEPVPIIFEYEGNLKDYSYELSVLPKAERIKAIKYLSGFEGDIGYQKLSQIDGFENVDASTLEDQYVEYTVDVNGKKYPYRVLMFYIEEDDWEQIYYERYCYFKVNDSWKLGRITKEYYSDYRQRVKYIHGVSGSETDTLHNVYTEVFQGSNWDMAPDEIAAANNTDVVDNKISIDDALLFRMPVSLTYQFTDNWLSSVQYKLINAQSYYSAFVSLYIRFYDPITVNANGDMTWSLPDTLITLKYDDIAPTITISPRHEQEDLSVGKTYISNALT